MKVTEQKIKKATVNELYNLLLDNIKNGYATMLICKELEQRGQ